MWNKFKELLRKQFYPVRFLEERWYKWYGLHQRFNQIVQEYMTEFQQQAMVLNITTDEYSIFIKYMAGLNDYIRKEMKLFTIETIAEASVNAIAIEGKQKKGNKTKGDSGKAGLTCNHYKQTWHMADRCWEKYPHLKPKGLRRRRRRKHT